jgi:hypothetical protein
VQRIAAEFPHRVTSADDVPDATQVYREVLEKQADASVVIVTGVTPCRKRPPERD